MSRPTSQPALQGLTALVTGAGRGIGRACALALGAAGAEVIAVSRTAAEIEAVAAAIRAADGQARALVCDVTDSAAVAARIGAEPRIDILVNNAGGNVPEPFLDVAEATLDHLITLNVRSVYLVAQTAVRIMINNASTGVVINMSSQMGHVGGPNRTVYCMTKHAIEGLTKAMAIELGPRGIRVNTVAPTFVDTPLTRPFFADAKFRQWVEDSIPLGRMATVEEVAAAVVFLASPAAAIITGTSLLVDGGWTAR